jgi:hypothetical protein
MPVLLREWARAQWEREGEALRDKAIFVGAGMEAERGGDRHVLALLSEGDRRGEGECPLIDWQRRIEPSGAHRMDGG